MNSSVVRTSTSRESKVLKENQVRKVSPVRKGNKVFKVRQDRQEPKGLSDLKV